MPSSTEQTIREMHDRYDALGGQLAGLLNAADIQGGGWTHEADFNVYGSLTLHHPAGFGITVAHHNARLAGGAGRRLTVDGLYPRAFYGDRSPTITVGIDQPATWLARRIITKFLPGYMNVLPRAFLHHRQEERHRAGRIRTNRSLESALSQLRPGAADGSADRTHSYAYLHFQVEGNDEQCRIRTRVDDTGRTVNLALDRVPADLAARVLEVLNAAPPLEGRIVSATRALQSPLAAVSPSRTIVGEVLHSAGGHTPGFCPGALMTPADAGCRER
ncbi:hypothetical protein [Streptomyces venezuelae]|uniref:hypothetical protein n=1 Tax=Streptomyces venezuelae TaxID=54571 RepID=UPI003426E959